MQKKTPSGRVINFLSLLTHTKGQWAGKPFKVLPWQKDFIRPVYDTLKISGLRQYRICYIEIPKKNGKTEIAAGLALYHLCADYEKSPEVFSAAADREQASLVYMVAAQMVRSNNDLSKKLLVRDSKKRIIYPKKNGFYQALSSEVASKHGYSPSAVIFDELHAQPNAELWRVLTAGTDYARAQQIIYVLTTAGIYDINSIWWKIRKKAIQVQKGIIKDKTFFPVLFIADHEKDEVSDEKVWKRVNPSLGRIFTLEKIRDDYEIAKNDPIELQDFKRFRLNIPIKSLSRWLDMLKWQACKGDYVPEDLRGEIAFGGIDLSSTQDLTSRILVFPRENEPWRILSHSYCPEDTILKKARIDKVPYDIWAEQGYITPTPGDYVDYRYVIKDVVKDAEMYDLIEVGYDPWAAGKVAGELNSEYGIVMVEMRQGTITLSEPIKDILKSVLALLLQHNGSPVLRWCVDNVVMVYDHNENLRPAKDKSTGRIDEFVALIMAWGRAMASFGTAHSVYEKRGLIEV